MRNNKRNVKQGGESQVSNTSNMENAEIDSYYEMKKRQREK